MATYYAWSNFPVERNEWGQVTKTIKAGEKVSQSDLPGVSDEEWQELVDAGAVREEEYPADLPPNVSPAEYLLQQASAKAQMDEAQARLDLGQQEESKSAPAKPASPSAGKEASK